MLGIDVEKMLQTETNAYALCWMYQQYSIYELGSQEFKEKLEVLLEGELEKKRCTLLLDEVIPTLNVMGLSQC